MKASASVTQPVVILAGKQGHRSDTPLIDLGLDQHERDLGPALELAPGVGSAAPLVDPRHERLGR